MSVAHCSPSSSSHPTVHWGVLVIIVIIAASWQDAAKALEAVVGAVAALSWWAYRGHMPAVQ